MTTNNARGNRVFAGMATAVALALGLASCGSPAPAGPPQASEAKPPAPMPPSRLYSADAATEPLPAPGVPALPGWKLVPRTATSIPLSTVILPGAPTVNQEPLARYGYIEEEYFLAGVANVYAAGGKGVVRPNVPYATRILVRRPADPKRFSGTIVMEPSRDLNEWTTVLLAGWPRFLRHGDIMVAWSMAKDNVPALVKKYDPVRYAPIDIPDDGLRWDIMAQTAWLLRSPDGPLGKLGFIARAAKVKGGLRLYSTGASLTGSMQLSFINNGHQARARRPDGGPLIDAFVPVVSAGPLDPPSDAAVIRILSESEYQSPGTSDKPGAWANRRPDSDLANARLRTYDIAGASHAGWIDQSQFNIAFFQLGPQAIDQFTPRCVHTPSDLPSKVNFIRAAFANLDRWERDGVAPPAGRVFALNPDHTLKRDAGGAVEGGVRPYWVDVPTSHFRIDNAPSGPTGSPATGGVCGQLGYEERYSPEEIARLYPVRSDYARKIADHEAALVREHYLLPEDAAEERARATLRAAPAP